MALQQLKCCCGGRAARGRSVLAAFRICEGQRRLGGALGRAVGVGQRQHAADVDAEPRHALRERYRSRGHGGCGMLWRRGFSGAATVVGVAGVVSAQGSVRALQTVRGGSKLASWMLRVTADPIII